MDNKRIRMTPKDRRETIMRAAIDLAREYGYENISQSDIALRAGCAKGLVIHYFATMPQLRRALMRAAITQEVVEIVAQGLAAGDNYARKAPEELKRRAVESLMV